VIVCPGVSHAGVEPNGYGPITSTGVPGVVTFLRVSSSFHWSPHP
jgi:hypothetical protein